MLNLEKIKMDTVSTNSGVPTSAITVTWNRNSET
jgi:hypothetical protein